MDLKKHHAISDDDDDDDQELMRSLIKMLQSFAYLAQEPSSVWVLLPASADQTCLMQCTPDKHNVKLWNAIFFNSEKYSSQKHRNTA